MSPPKHQMLDWQKRVRAERKWQPSFHFYSTQYDADSPPPPIFSFPAASGGIWTLNLRITSQCEPLRAAMWSWTLLPEQHFLTELFLKRTRCQFFQYFFILYEMKDYKCQYFFFFSKDLTTLERTSAKNCCWFSKDDISFEAFAVSKPTVILDKFVQ